MKATPPGERARADAELGLQELVPLHEGVDGRGGVGPMVFVDADELFVFCPLNNEGKFGGRGGRGDAREGPHVPVHNRRV